MVFFRRSSRRCGRERVAANEAGPSESVEVESLHGETVRFDDDEEDDDRAAFVDDAVGEGEGEGFNVMFFVSIAAFAVSAVVIVVQRIFSAVSRDSGRELNPRKALVLRLPPSQAQKRSRNRRFASPDLNLTFVVPEDFKIGYVTASQIREAWQKALCFVQDECQVVDQLVRRGAQCIGMAATGTTPFSMIEGGDEIFRNPEMPGTVTGGEYSGCAILVKASHADFGLALDTLGSARVAASCCGVIGFRPTYGANLLHGISLKSEALDSCAFIVKEHQYLTRIGEMMDLPGQSNLKGDVITILFAMDLFSEWIQSDGKEMVCAVMKAAASWAGQDQVEEVDLSEFLSGYAKGWEAFDSDNVYEALRKAAATIAKYELKCKQHKDYNLAVEERPSEQERYHQALEVRHAIQEAFKLGVRESKLVMFPSVLQPPPSRDADESELRQFEIEAERLHALATLIGCPQIVFPMHDKSRNLYSVSILSLNKTDKKLLAVSEKLIPLTHRMLNKEILNSLQQQRRQQEVTQDERVAQRLSEGEEEGKRWHELGNEMYKESEYEKAVFAYTEAIRHAPHTANSYSNRAMAYIKLTQFEEAEEDCNKALVLDSHNAKALLRRGTSRKGLGLYIEAQEDFEKVLLIEPNNRQARNELRELERYFDQV